MKRGEGINIFSGEKGLGGALTNPTVIAFRKRNIQNQYPVRFFGVNYLDAEEAYQKNKIEGDRHGNDLLMTRLIGIKLRQNPVLMEAIATRGGADFIAACTHWTNAKTASSRAWEGAGLESRFIRNLQAGYDLAMSGLHIEGELSYQEEMAIKANEVRLVGYHGSDVDFDLSNMAPTTRGTFGEGYYFTDTKSSASDYGDHVACAQIRLLNPWRIEVDWESLKSHEMDFDHPGIEAILALEGGETLIQEALEGQSHQFDGKLTKLVVAKGHDGIIARYPDGSKEIVAFSKLQISWSQKNVSHAKKCSEPGPT